MLSHECMCVCVCVCVCVCLYVSVYGLPKIMYARMCVLEHHDAFGFPPTFIDASRHLLKKSDLPMACQVVFSRQQATL